MLVVCNSSHPEWCVKKDERAFRNFFQQLVELPLPDYGSRQVNSCKLIFWDQAVLPGPKLSDNSMPGVRPPWCLPCYCIETWQALSVGIWKRHWISQSGPPLETQPADSSAIHCYTPFAGTTCNNKMSRLQ